MLFKDTVYMLP